MENYYKISQISKLYGIGVDSLRYYEKLGLLKPKRGANNYRLYSLNDFYILNIISDLRRLGFSVGRIKEYLDKQSLKNSLKLFKKERETVRKQINQLLEIDRSLMEKISIINKSSCYETDVYKIKTLEKRPCVQLNTNISRDEEADFAISRLNLKYEGEIFNLGKQPIGASISKEDVGLENFSHFSRIFYILEDEVSDFYLPEGNYLSFFYSGNYNLSKNYIKNALEYAEAKNYKILDDVYEIYHIDNRYTINPKEFLTEIQVLVG